MKHPHLMQITDFREQTFVGGHGPWLRDDKGEEYLDFFADVGTASLGYGSSEINSVLGRLIEGPIHAPNLFQHKRRNEVAARLCALTKMDKVFFCNSGAEAVEAAIKLARLYWHKLRSSEELRSSIWSYSGGFHGRTSALIWVGDGAPYHREGFGQCPPGLGNHFGEDYTQIPDDAAAVILAPVFGNNDVLVYPIGWLKGLRKYCTDRGILLIFDEVQTGAGRCGALTYGQKVGIRPDILTLAKGIAMGAPVGIMLANGAVADTFTPGSHWSTFGGNPLSVEFIDGMLNWLEGRFGNEPGGEWARYSQINMNGAMIRSYLSGQPWAHNVRGEGMLIAFDIKADAKEFATAAMKRSLIIGAFRSGHGPVKITPPLNTSLDDISFGLAAMSRAAEDVNADFREPSL